MFRQLTLISPAKLGPRQIGPSICLSQPTSAQSDQTRSFRQTVIHLKEQQQSECKQLKGNLSPVSEALEADNDPTLRGTGILRRPGTLSLNVPWANAEQGNDVFRAPWERPPQQSDQPSRQSDNSNDGLLQQLLDPVGTEQSELPPGLINALEKAQFKIPMGPQFRVEPEPPRMPHILPDFFRFMKKTRGDEWRATLDRDLGERVKSREVNTTARVIRKNIAARGDEWPLGVPAVAEYMEYREKWRGPRLDHDWLPVGVPAEFVEEKMNMNYVQLPFHWNMKRHKSLKMILSLPVRQRVLEARKARDGGEAEGLPADAAEWVRRRSIRAQGSPIKDSRKFDDQEIQTIETETEELFAGDAWPDVAVKWARDFSEAYDTWVQSEVSNAAVKTPTEAPLGPPAYNYLFNKKYTGSPGALVLSRWLLDTRESYIACCQGTRAYRDDLRRRQMKNGKRKPEDFKDDSDWDCSASFNEALVRRARAYEKYYKEGIAEWLEFVLPELQDAYGEDWKTGVMELQQTPTDLP